MPYAANEHLPARVRDNLPPHAQDIYREAFNHAFDRHHDDARAARIAWAAVERSFEKVNGRWLPRDRDW